MLEELLNDGFGVVVEDQLEQLDPLVFQCLVDERVFGADLLSLVTALHSRPEARVEKNRCGSELILS